MNIRAGAMRTPITIQKPSTVRGTLGQTTYEDFITALAEVKTLTGREINSPQMSGSDANTEIITRYVPGIDANDRVLIGSSGRRFVVRYTNVETEGCPRFTHIFCREILTA